MSFDHPSCRILRRFVGLCWACLLLCLMPQPSSASTRHDVSGYTVTQWNIQDGLPHNLPLAIAQDSRGRMWIGTWEGLVRFDGHRFHPLDHRAMAGASLAGSAALLAEPDGSVLVGNGKGVHRLQGNTGALLHPDLAGVRSEVMLRTRDGVLWLVSGDQLLSLHPVHGLHRIPLGPAPVQVFAMTELPDGRLLLGTERGLFHVDDGVARPWSRGQALGDASVLHISQDAGGWLLATTAGAWQLSASLQLQAVGPRRRVDRAVRAPDGAIWLNPHQGDLLRVDAEGRQLAFPIPGLRARSLLVDREGAVWGGTTLGLFRIARGVAHRMPDSAGYVRAVLEDAQGQLWIGHGQGLRLVQGGMVRDVFEDSVLALAPAADGNGVWAGTYASGVVRLDSQGRVIQRIAVADERTSGLIRAVLQTADGTVWIGSGAMGLLRWHKGRLERVGTAATLPMQGIQALYADSDGGVLVGSDAGMARIDPQGSLRYWAPEKDMPAGSVFDFLRDPDGSLWIGSDRGLLHLRGDRFEVFGRKAGLPHEKIFRVLDDGRHFWLSGTLGVMRVDRRELEQLAGGRRAYLSVAVVDHSDGLPGGQVNGGSWPAGWRRADGSLLFPTADGVGQLDSAAVANRQQQPVPIDLEQVLVDGISLPVQQQVHVEAGVRRLVFGFTGLSYQAPERVRYRYRLAGFDPEWIDADAVGQAVFTNLPAGRFQLEVEAMSLPLDWEDRERVGSHTVDVVVDAPFWQHPVAVVAGTVGFLGLLYGVMWLRTLSYQRSQRRLNRIIEQRTDELVMKNFELEAAGRERDALVEKLEHQARHDALTELPNRRAGDERLQASISRAQAGGLGVCVALLDVDWFKRVNDQYGHPTGDRLLCHLARSLEKSDCGTVFAARHGGEEFLLVLDGMTLAVALYRMERLRSEVEHTPLILEDGRRLHYTVSIGVAALDAGSGDARELLATADANLYQAKRAGRNRVVG